MRKFLKIILLKLKTFVFSFNNKIMQLFNLTPKNYSPLNKNKYKKKYFKLLIVFTHIVFKKAISNIQAILKNIISGFLKLKYQIKRVEFNIPRLNFSFAKRNIFHYRYEYIYEYIDLTTQPKTQFIKRINQRLKDTALFIKNMYFYKPNPIYIDTGNQVVVIKEKQYISFIDSIYEVINSTLTYSLPFIKAGLKLLLENIYIFFETIGYWIIDLIYDINNVQKALFKFTKIYVFNIILKEMINIRQCTLNLGKEIVNKLFSIYTYGLRYKKELLENLKESINKKRYLSVLIFKTISNTEEKNEVIRLPQIKLVTSMKSSKVNYNYLSIGIIAGICLSLIFFLSKDIFKSSLMFHSITISKNKDSATQALISIPIKKLPKLLVVNNVIVKNQLESNSWRNKLEVYYKQDNNIYYQDILYYKKEYKRLAEQVLRDLDKNIVLSENRNKDSQYDLRLILK